jgi:hypothetical protein
MLFWKVCSTTTKACVIDGFWPVVNKVTTNTKWMRGRERETCLPFFHVWKKETVKVGTNSRSPNGREQTTRKCKLSKEKKGTDPLMFWRRSFSWCVGVSFWILDGQRDIGTHRVRARVVWRSSLSLSRWV